MENESERNAVFVLVGKVLQISSENHEYLKQRADLEAVISSNNARLSDCEAGLRVLGQDISQHEVWDNLFQSYITELKRHSPPPMMNSGEYEVFRNSLNDTRSIAAPSSISKLLLERLDEIGSKGSKSMPLREWLRKTHNLETHYKTVGMTLYRLSQESPPKVHRRGHVWFFGPPYEEQPKDPGVDAPGQLDILQER
jgi:hypothetical protein